jgi:hypothetical protein
MLVERTRLAANKLAKRGTSEIDPQIGQYIASFPGGLAMIENLQIYGPTRTPPVSRIPHIQEAKVAVWKSRTGAVARKVRYGPYRIPPVNEKNAASEVLHIRGVSNTFKFNVSKPCEGDCTILTLSADLEYEDGTAATTQNGVSDHVVFLLRLQALLTWMRRLGYITSHYLILAPK